MYLASHIRRLSTAHYACPNASPVLPLASSILPSCGPCSSVLPLKRPYFLSESKKTMPNPKLGVYIIHIYYLLVNPALFQIRIPNSCLPGISNLIYQRSVSNALRSDLGGQKEKCRSRIKLRTGYHAGVFAHCFQLWVQHRSPAFVENYR